jgi:hypothetical protein
VNDTSARIWILLSRITCIHFPDSDGGIITSAQKEFSSFSPAQRINTTTGTSRLAACLWKARLIPCVTLSFVLSQYINSVECTFQSYCKTSFSLAFYLSRRWFKQGHSSESWHFRSEYERIGI